jgi:acetyl esterase/lipase
MRFLVLVLAGSVLLQGQSGQVEPQRIAYGAESTSFGELRLPSGAGPFPVAVLIHGGCWLASRGGVDGGMQSVAVALANRGIATWNIEYRRVGHPGGGWPGSYHDLSTATDFVRTLAKSHPLDLSRVALVGHSSGGYFAGWIAGRRNLPSGSPLTSADPISLIGVVVLDAFLDYRVIDSRGVDGRLYCDEPISSRLFGGDPDTVPDHVRQASPLALLPYGVPQEYVVSSRRYPVKPARPLADGRTTLEVLDYPALARAAGDRITVHVVRDAEHSSFVNAKSPTWPAVEAAIVRVLSGPSVQAPPVLAKLEEDRARCRTEKIALGKELASVFRDFDAAQDPRPLEVLVATDGRIRALLRDRPDYRPCETDGELIYDKRWERMGIATGYWGDLHYSGRLLVLVHRNAPRSPLRAYTLFSTVFGETPSPGLGVMPDIDAAHAYVAEFPEGPFIRDVYQTIADFHKDLFMVLRDRRTDYKYRCFAPYIVAGAWSNQPDRAKSVAVDYYQRVLRLNPEDERVRTFLDETKKGIVQGWSFCAD